MARKTGAELIREERERQRKNKESDWPGKLMFFTVEFNENDSTEKKINSLVKAGAFIASEINKLQGAEDIEQ